jgi:AbrB family looped-hinge helix DNA binding protein
MIIAIDKRGSINLPSSIRKELGLKSGDHLDLSILEGGSLLLQPVIIYPRIRLSEEGLALLKEARESGIGTMPEWFLEELEDAQAEYEREISSGPRNTQAAKRRSEENSQDTDIPSK